MDRLRMGHSRRMDPRTTPRLPWHTSGRSRFPTNTRSRFERNQNHIGMGDVKPGYCRLNLQ